MKSPFDRHPAADFVFYLAAFALSISTNHPLFLAVSLISPLLYSLMLSFKDALKTFTFVCLPVFTVILSATVLFSHYGITTLKVLSDGNRITLEALACGTVYGTKTVSLILWFFCFSEVVTEEKYLHAIGRISPRLATYVSVVLRFIPFYFRLFISTLRVQRKIRNPFSAFFSSSASVFRYSVEKSFETDASMKSRGFGLKKRTSYSKFRFGSSDVAAVTAASVFAAACVIFHRISPAQVLYNPLIIIEKPSCFEAAAMLCYATFGLTPSVLYLIFRLKTEVILSKE